MTDSGESSRFKQLLILRDTLVRNPYDATAWYKLATLIGDPEREKFCLEQVLKINLRHAIARKRLDELLHAETESVSAPEDPNTWREARCPYMGLINDAQTLAAYASVKNHCYRLKEPKPVKLDYQQKYCLSPAHQHCLVYKHGKKAVA